MRPYGSPRPSYPPVGGGPPVRPYGGMPHGGPPGYGHAVGRPPPRGLPAAGGSPDATSTEKLTTLFVGAIPAGIPDSWIEKLLKATGKLRNWKRVKDQSGNPKGFGFAEYEDPDSVLRALLVLSSETETGKGIVLKAMDGSETEKKLIVKADDNVRNYLDQYQKQRTKTSEDEEKDKEVQQAVNAIVEAIVEGRDPDEAGKEKDAQAERDEDIISKELSAFRERATMRDNDRQNNDRQWKNRRGSDDYDSKRRAGRYAGRQEFLRGPTEQISEQEDDEEDDEELERKRQEKHARDVEAAFRQREKRYESREAARLRNYERDLQHAKEDSEREERNRDYFAKRLAEWDDEIEMERGEELYYIDRSRWRKLREGVRRREEERDEEDRRQEAFEIEEERRRAEEEERMKLESTNVARQSEEVGKIAMKPTKLNFNLPIKRVANMGGAEDEDDEDEGSGKRRRVLVPLDYGDDLALDDTSNMDREERVRRVKELIDSIPSSEQELWNWNVKWNELDEDLITSKLQPFVAKKIVELVGVEEDELISFILDNVRRKSPPSDLVKELEMTLDEEALVFVMKLWRALIFETERKSRKL
ncbi:hypothetical protein EC973_005167 [Apophysomyces ossiformis]|uniref:Uncharacterized protein n=1 Tax=Apophysomyces ossiformis TaxID=679940 RepID=A0A8H7BW02_9FUNG|nr:hypothetical protein EC973_005167 [Apophysomyces ossiformis]